MSVELKNTAPIVDYVLFIGRFEPYHNGHDTVARVGLERGSKIIFILGSAHEPRMPKNPWNVTERAAMIRHSLAEHSDRVLIGAVVTHGALTRWMGDVQREVNRLIVQDGGDPTTATVRILGRDKDASSYYIHHFPQYGPLISVERSEVMGATEMRDHYFAADRGGDLLIQANVPTPVYDLVMAFRRAPAYAGLVRCHEELKRYRITYGPGPFLTVDSAILCQGHVLLVTRKNHPGMNQLAMPGGFKDPRETLLDAALREVTEETHLEVSKEKLRASLRQTLVLDAVDRDPRADMVSHVFVFVLNEETVLPTISAVGGDDTKKAEWMPVSEMLNMRERMFADHFPTLERIVNHSDLH
jgi:bifunctional NMN adenylyltransferase/nudix hydrolase